MIDEEENNHDADSGNDGSSNEMLQKEGLIDPGNEHNHLDKKDEQFPEKQKKHDADSGGDASGSVGPEPPE